MDKWIPVVQLIVLILSAILTISQLSLLRRQIKEQHEERRRERIRPTLWLRGVIL